MSRYSFFILILSFFGKPAVKKIEQQENASMQGAFISGEKRYCLYDNPVSTLGVGLIIAPDTFSIFNDLGLKQRYAKIDMKRRAVQDVCPKFFQPENQVMHFVCTEVTDKAYRVLINESDTKFISRKYKFQTWEEYILTSYAVRRIALDTGASYHHLKLEPNLQAASLQLPAHGLEMLCPLEVKGDWLKVKHDCFYDRYTHEYEGQPCREYVDKCENAMTGWVPWRQGNILLIDIYLRS